MRGSRAAILCSDHDLERLLPAVRETKGEHPVAVFFERYNGARHPQIYISYVKLPIATSDRIIMLQRGLLFTPRVASDGLLEYEVHSATGQRGQPYEDLLIGPRGVERQLVEDGPWDITYVPETGYRLDLGVGQKGAGRLLVNADELVNQDHPYFAVALTMLEEARKVQPRVVRPIPRAPQRTAWF